MNESQSTTEYVARCLRRCDAIVVFPEPGAPSTYSTHAECPIRRSLASEICSYGAARRRRFQSMGSDDDERNDEQHQQRERSPLDVVALIAALLRD
jgi:hypothetical protein